MLGEVGALTGSLTGELKRACFDSLRLFEAFIGYDPILEGLL